ncbi:MAG: 30S ribosomal protein S6 [Thermoplasmata archaeon]|nr:30S ribosomal protein S6 [Thermoplasmata archaeon]
MRPYEVMVIFDAEREEADLRVAIDRYTGILTTGGAELGTVDVWGKRKFAYRLAHRWEGYYVVLQARSEPAVMDELSHALSLADEVLRHKVLRIPEKVYGAAGGTSSPPPVTAAVLAESAPDDSSLGAFADATSDDE